MVKGAPKEIATFGKPLRCLQSVATVIVRPLTGESGFSDNQACGNQLDSDNN